MAAGIIMLKDNVGANSNTEVHATYAYRIDLDQKYFSFGLQAGVVNFRSNNGDLNPYDELDPVFMGTMNITKPSFGAGAILHSDSYFFGLSVPRLLKSKATFADLETELYSMALLFDGCLYYLSQRAYPAETICTSQGGLGSKTFSRSEFCPEPE